ncbi:MAG: response regulator [Bacteroidales bacterium]|nr:response regulator [Bacteroidales bacterium]
MTIGFLPGLAALIENRAHYGFGLGTEKKHADWLGLIAGTNNNTRISRPFNNNSEVVYNWQDKVILIAEDEDANFLYLKVALSKTKATVIRAKNGREAVDMARTNPDIDLVLMDIKMPVMNGIDATKVIKSFNGSMVVIAQTAYANENDRDIYLNAGCNDFLAKPITRDKLLRIISQYL